MAAEIEQVVVGQGWGGGGVGVDQVSLDAHNILFCSGHLDVGADM